MGNSEIVQPSQESHINRLLHTSVNRRSILKSVVVVATRRLVPQGVSKHALHSVPEVRESESVAPVSFPEEISADDYTNEMFYDEIEGLIERNPESYANGEVAKTVIFGELGKRQVFVTYSGPPWLRLRNVSYSLKDRYETVVSLDVYGEESRVPLERDFARKLSEQGKKLGMFDPESLPYYYRYAHRRLINPNLREAVTHIREIASGQFESGYEGLLLNHRIPHQEEVAKNWVALIASEGEPSGHLLQNYKDSLRAIGASELEIACHVMDSNNLRLPRDLFSHSLYETPTEEIVKQNMDTRIVYTTGKRLIHGFTLDSLLQATQEVLSEPIYTATLDESKKLLGIETDNIDSLSEGDVSSETINPPLSSVSRSTL